MARIQNRVEDRESRNREDCDWRQVSSCGAAARDRPRVRQIPIREWLCAASVRENQLTCALYLDNAFRASEGEGHRRSVVSAGKVRAGPADPDPVDALWRQRVSNGYPIPWALRARASTNVPPQHSHPESSHVWAAVSAKLSSPFNPFTQGYSATSLVYCIVADQAHPHSAVAT